MANRYWVGGTASWDSTAGTKWALTSGGAGGQAVPTSADAVFFDAASGAVTVTIATVMANALSINCTGFTGTLTNNAGATIAGSLTLVSGMTFTGASYTKFTGTGTITSAGKQLRNVTIDGSGITVSLGDALNLGGTSLTIDEGTFNTNNNTVTASTITRSTTTTATLTLGSSTVNLNSISLGVSANLTVTANTATINCSSSSATCAFGNKTFYNVNLTSTASGTRTLESIGSITNLTLSAGAAGFTTFNFASTATITGALTFSGTGPTTRAFVKSSVLGTARTLTVASLSAADCDFRDISLAGAASGSAPTRAGDCGGNSSITFPAAKTVYRVGTNTTWAGSSSWATTSGGAGSDNNFPLAQDTAVIDEATTLSGTLTTALYNMSALDCSTRTSAITISYGSASSWYGSHSLGAGVTVSGTTSQSFVKRGTMVFTSAGRTVTFPIAVQGLSGTLQLGDDFLSASYINVDYGTFNANNYSVTCTYFTSSNSNTRTITMGSGLWTLSDTGTIWDLGTTTGLTFNAGTANILLSNTSTTARAFIGGSLSYNKLTIGGATGTSITTISSGSSFTELASTKTVAHTIRFSGNLGTIGTWSVTGTSGNVVTIDSSTNTVRRTVTVTNNTAGAIDYMNIRDFGELSGGKMYVGLNSTNSGNNLSIYFTDTIIAGNSLFFGSNF